MQTPYGLFKYVDLDYLVYNSIKCPDIYLESVSLHSITCWVGLAVN